jgi:hypothetical protein
MTPLAVVELFEPAPIPPAPAPAELPKAGGEKADAKN